MRIQCNDVQSFIANLEGQTVHQKTVFVNVTKHSLTEEPVREATSVEVFLQLSAVIQYPGEDGDALVESGESCGIDRYTVDGALQGKEQCDHLIDLLRVFCDQSGLMIKPGILGV